jgi:hypothetical protein
MAVRRQALGLAARTLEQRLNADTSDYAGPELPCSCGGPAKYHGRHEKTFESVLGPLRLGRAYYHCKPCQSGFCPRDRALGLGLFSLTPGVLRMTASTVTLVSFEESSGLLHELAGVEVSAKQVERAAESRGAEIAEAEKKQVEKTGKVAPTMYLGMDGTGVPMRTQEVIGTPANKPMAPRKRARPSWLGSGLRNRTTMKANPCAILDRSPTRQPLKAQLPSGLILLGAGCILFWPAAMVGAYSYFLCALFVIASGLSFLETAANLFVAQLGDPENAARRLNFAQAFNPLGAIMGALIGTRFIFSGIESTREQVAAMQTAHTYAGYLRAETLRAVTPYLVLSAAALLLAVVVRRVVFPPVAVESRMGTLGLPGKGGFRDLLDYPHFLLAIVAQFMYVGAQVGTWSYFIQYVQDSVHAPEKTAGYFLTGTLASFGVGRIVSSLLMRWISPARLMGVYGLVNSRCWRWASPCRDGRGCG